MISHSKKSITKEVTVSPPFFSEICFKTLSVILYHESLYEIKVSVYLYSNKNQENFNSSFVVICKVPKEK